MICAQPWGDKGEREVVSLLRAHFTEKTISPEGSAVDSFYSSEPCGRGRLEVRTVQGQDQDEESLPTTSVRRSSEKIQSL